MTTLRLLDTSHQADFERLWRVALTEQADYFRSDLSDYSELCIPTGFTDDSFTLGAFSRLADTDTDELVGIVSLQRDTKLRLNHKALVFGMFVHPSHAGKGIGRRLITQLLQEVKKQSDIQQLYLTVLASNTRAQGLYASFGFEKFAHEPQSVRINDTLVDEWQMVLLIDEEVNEISTWV